jgi:hypothetical protein
MSHEITKMRAMEITAINETNYLEYLDTLSAMGVLEIVSTIVSWADETHSSYRGELDYIFEKPHKFPEIFVPAINGDLPEFRDSEIATLREMFGA